MLTDEQDTSYIAWELWRTLSDIAALLSHEGTWYDGSTRDERVERATHEAAQVLERYVGSPWGWVRRAV